MHPILFLLTMILLLNPAHPLYCAQSAMKKPLKVLVLIITSDDVPVYKELQKIWQRYMHNDPEHVEVYFIRGDPALPVDYAIEGDVVWSKTAESIMPGIINKTILSLEGLLPRIHTEFDYVLRTNLSSFYVFPRLLKFLERCPRQQLYCGSTDRAITFCSGSGFLLTPDLAQMLVDHKSYFLNNNRANDDVLIGNFFKEQGIRATPHFRIDFCSLHDWYILKNMIPDNVFHFRVKNPNAMRLTDDILMHSALLKMFYPHAHA